MGQDTTTYLDLFRDASWASRNTSSLRRGMILGRYTVLVSTAAATSEGSPSTAPSTPRGPEHVAESSAESMLSFDPSQAASLDLVRFEEQLVREAFRRIAGHLTRAAERLGISRQALRRRLNRYASMKDDGDGL